MLPKLRPIVKEITDQFNHGAARAGKKEKMWTEASKYCDLVNRRRDVRVVPPPDPTPLIGSLTQVMVAVEFDLGQELQTGATPELAFSRSV